MALPFGIQQSTLAGGLAGIIGWGAMLGLAAVGVPVPAAVITPLALLLATVVVHYVPDAAVVDKDIKDLAPYIPTTEAKYDIQKNKPNV